MLRCQSLSCVPRKDLHDQQPRDVGIVLRGDGWWRFGIRGKYVVALGGKNIDTERGKKKDTNGLLVRPGKEAREILLTCAEG